MAALFFFLRIALNGAILRASPLLSFSSGSIAL